MRHAHLALASSREAIIATHASENKDARKHVRTPSSPHKKSLRPTMNRARRCLSTITIEYNLHAASVLCAVALGLSAVVGAAWLSEEASAVLWPWQRFIPAHYALNALLLLVLGIICSAKLRPLSWGRRARLQPLVAKRMYYVLWLVLNMAWLAAG